MEPANDAETVETHGEVTTDVLPSSQTHAIDCVTGTLSHDGRYIQYTILESIFEVTAKYKPPIVPIGRGAYGIVCAARNSENNEEVAIKKIMHAFANIIEAKRTLCEIKLLRHFNHETIVGIRDVIVPPQRHSYEDVYIAYELMDTDLYEVLRSDQELIKDHILFFLYDILRGLKYIHSANVLHRDLKPSNILLNRNCDFGLACAMSESGFNDQVHQLRLLMELIGTPSEEELGSLNENAKRYIRQLPLLPRQSFSEKFPSVPPLTIDLVEKMLTFDPRQRISVTDALAHPYFSPIRNIDDEPECTVPFNFDLEQHPLTEEYIKELIYSEALAFSPEYQQ